MSADGSDKKIENDRAVAAGNSPQAKNEFLQAEQQHILYLTARILGRTISTSDDEWSVTLSAVSEAIDSFDSARGNFWNYAAMVIGSRLRDHYRAKSRFNAEILTGNDSFDGEIEDEDGQTGLKIEIRDATAVVVDTDLKDEIAEFKEELGRYGIELFELPEYAPKADKTRNVCARLINVFFDPPPLLDELKRTGAFPFKSLAGRMTISRKIVDRYRKYLIAAVLIKGGDYPHMAEYLPKEA